MQKTQNDRAKTQTKLQKSPGLGATHLHFQDKHLLKIPKFSNTSAALVLYLYNNRIKTIDHLGGFSRLTSLYLQNNQIDKVENLKNLKSLKKLYLGKNRIGVLEGLESNETLEALHVERQRVPLGSPLCFDPRTIFTLSDTLQILNVSHNRLSSISVLAPLKRLHYIDASFNDLDNVEDITNTIRDWLCLKEAKFAGNPVSKRYRYREDIIANTHCLESLDDKSISDFTRSFIKGFEEGKLNHALKRNVNLADLIPGLPRNYPLGLQRAASASMVRDSGCQLTNDLSTFNDGHLYTPWNLLPRRRPMSRPVHSRTIGTLKMNSNANILVNKIK
ncbi:protein phosphatase 1 regulatory subunit 42-like [Cylas formicarius]|uniref:protein phosphatase 1 regulatory subunit 42-like n=1 Tax=Cylas formicarius TaxID=197179 RepID=UPI0029586D6C|nr:protein phosphatase 1 regulatory subunit 42-like [Cylas formicarius]